VKDNRDDDRPMTPAEAEHQASLAIEARALLDRILNGDGEAMETAIAALDEDGEDEEKEAVSFPFDDNEELKAIIAALDDELKPIIAALEADKTVEAALAAMDIDDVVKAALASLDDDSGPRSGRE
jgi:hypothetical protein